MHFKLIEEIINLSSSKNWDGAKNEWNFEFAYMCDEFQRCLCGHYPIREICVIKNKINDNEAEVGNCCVNKFLGIDSANKIFESVKRIKGDNKKSMSAEVLDYLHSKIAINDFEFNFYKNIIRKRKLSDKQQEIKLKINNKLVSFTSYEANSNFTKINKVLLWAETKPDFDTSFILSLKAYCAKNGCLSENQTIAIDKIISKFKI